MKLAIVFATLCLGALTACPQGQKAGGSASGSGGTVLELYDVELRETLNTCREQDNQVAKETLFLERFGDRGVLHLGAERSFPVELAGEAVSANFLETDHATVAGRHVVCKRLTRIDLSLKEGRVNGTYERKRRQECLMDAKPCQTTWSVTGALRSDK